MRVKILTEGGSDTYEHVDAIHSVEEIREIAPYQDRRTLFVNPSLVTHILCEPDEPEQPSITERIVGG